MADPALHSRCAHPRDAKIIASILQEGFSTYCSWAPAAWVSPTYEAKDVVRLGRALARDDVWCLLATHATDPVGHVALAPFTREEPTPPASDTIYLWQLFVRSEWHGRGVARGLMSRAVDEAERRGFARLLLWTPRGAGRARRFYEREGWSQTGQVHEDSALGLPMLQYGRRITGRAL